MFQALHNIMIRLHLVFFALLIFIFSDVSSGFCLQACAKRRLLPPSCGENTARTIVVTRHVTLHQGAALAVGANNDHPSSLEHLANLIVTDRLVRTVAADANWTTATHQI